MKRIGILLVLVSLSLFSTFGCKPAETTKPAEGENVQTTNDGEDKDTKDEANATKGEENKEGEKAPE